MKLLRKRFTNKKKSTHKKRNLGKKRKTIKKRCPHCKRQYRKTNYKKKTKKNTTRKIKFKLKGGNKIAYYKLNNQNPAPRDFLTSSRIHGCAGGSRKKKGGAKRYTLIPQDLVNLTRDVGHNFNEVKSGFLGVDSKPSIYPTKDQPIDKNIVGEYVYSPTNIREIRLNAEKDVSML